MERRTRPKACVDGGHGVKKIWSLSLSSLEHVIAWDGAVQARRQFSYECDMGFPYVVALVLGHDIVVEASDHLVIKITNVFLQCLDKAYIGLIVVCWQGCR